MERNNKIWNNVIELQEMVLNRGTELFQSCQTAKNFKITLSPSYLATSFNKLSQPSTCRFKCNMDVSFSSLNNKVKINVCIIDEHGAFVYLKLSGSLLFAMSEWEKLLVYFQISIGFMTLI